MNKIEEYLTYLQSKGFHLGEDAIGFIYFGKNYTNASDELTTTAIELTLKAQRDFDGSFYVSLLEMLVSNKVKSRKEAVKFVKEKEVMII